MKYLLVAVFFGLCALSISVPHTHKVADKDFLEKQTNIFRLFKHINQPSYYKDHIEIAKTFSFEGHFDYYTKPEVAKHFYKYVTYGFFPRGHIFSVFNEEHLREAIALFKVFYYAKDFDTFYKTAVWARQYVNEGLFLYSFSVAVAHRPDCYGIILPPIYEVYPHYFFNSETIHQAQKYKQFYSGKAVDSAGYNGYTIYSNYSGHYLNIHPEQSISYYLEDVGINAFYYYVHIYYPFWFNSEEYGTKWEHRGEYYYYIHHQLLARYYLERLSNGFGEIPWFNWEVPFETGYYPSLTYPNGFEFPTRPHYAHLYEYFYNYGQKWNYKGKYGYSYTYVNNYERRIRDAVDSGFIFNREGQKYNIYDNEDGFSVFGNIIESNADSPNRRYYGPYHSFARHLLGYSYQPYDKYHAAPSALEHYETSLRDPAFYQLYKRIVTFFFKYKINLPPYTESDLYFPGVHVNKVEFDRLVTYFDHFYSDISSAVYVTPDEFQHDSFNVRVRQYRLNHKPFTYKIYVSSDKDVEASVRIFIGPRYDEYGRYINITENRLNFVEFDHFRYTLKSGENTIVRNSHENFFYTPDRTTYKELYQQVLGAHGGSSQYSFDHKESYGFPIRYRIPKGTYGGFDYQFYVIVNPYVPYKGRSSESHQYESPNVFANAPIDNYAFGFPFDRFIEFENFFNHVPNSYYYTTKIYHRNAEDINASHSVHDH